MVLTPTPAGRHFRGRPRSRSWAPSRLATPVAALAGVLGLGLLGTAAYTATAAPGTVRAAAATTSTRLAGSDRYATAAAVSAGTFSPGVAVAYLATGSDFPDALAAAAAAGGRGPVLLTSAAALPEATATELGRLRPARVVVAGGPNAVGEGVVNAVRALLPSAPVTRSAGVDRYDTAAMLSKGTFPAGAPLAYLTTGTNYPDALTAAAAAGGKGPVLLTRTASVPDATVSELRRLGVARIVVVGGAQAVSDATFLAVAAAVPSAPMSRVAGADRFATAAAVAGAGSATPSVIYLATGQDYPDALSAAAAAGGQGPVLLAGAGALPAATLGALQGFTTDQLIVVGGVNAISSGAESQARAAVSSTASASAVVPVSAKAGLAVAAARAQLGKPYQWAGAGPDTFDCSGLTMVAWRAAGVALPHNAAAQAALIPSVPLSALAPGDLVFYGNPDIYHVGIYIGGGQMIEAAHSGTLVRIADIHRPELLGAGRPG
ncbi:MAG: hypothetical protein NVSMB12_11340 [Acidimicrobiales bacterium]